MLISTARAIEVTGVSVGRFENGSCICVDVRSRSRNDAVAPEIWKAATEGRRLEVGTRYAEFSKHAENDRKAFAHQFLTHVDGLAYRSEEVLVVELLDKLRTLRAVHVGMNNFYNERNHARSLAQSLPPNRQVPKAARREWVKVICVCFIGNGLGYRDGVDEAATPYYTEHITAFGEAEFVDLFSDPEFCGDLGGTKPDERTRQLATFLKSKTQHVHILAGLDAVLDAPPQTLHKLSATATYRQQIAPNLPDAV